MLKITKSLLVLLAFILASCIDDGVPVGKEELELEFENIWWEIVDSPPLFGTGSEYCYYFDTTRFVEEPSDGVILSYEEGDLYSYILSEFERMNNGYYISKYDMILEIYVDETGTYVGNISQGILSHKSEIIPCSL
tara:strand:- start:180 stop:587 length:408 start_codon:yes stop_codon:yes gene_type:complete